MTPPLTGILLAAGSATRFGSDKLLHRLADGTPMGLAVGRALIRVLPDSVAVVRREGAQLAGLLAGAGFDVVVNDNADAGMGGSIARAVRERPDSAGWVIALADMPWLTVDTIARVSRRLAAGADLVAPAYRGRRGHPVGIAQQHRAALLALDGDRGARGLLAAHAATLELIDVEDPGACCDVDTPDALAALLSRPPQD